MKAAKRPSRDVMKDIVAVEWLPLSAAVRRLSYPLEKLFLQHAGRRALKRRRRKLARRSTRHPKATPKTARNGRATRSKRRKPRTARS